MMNYWNDIINSEDIVWHLGDVCFKWNKERTANFIMHLNGRKKLILGNHDKSRSITWWKDVGFEEIFDKPVRYNDNFIFSHEPMFVVPDRMINVHGHIHEKKIDLPNPEKYINVSVEQIDYRPKSLSEVLVWP